MSLTPALQDHVRERANCRCEYCGIPEAASRLPFQFDHIIASSHGGPTVAGNLACSCLPCNKHKGTNLSGIDPRTKKIVRLFHPRLHKWHYHFRWDGAELRGRTPIGRATVAVLGMNDPIYVAVRQELIDEGTFPPIQETSD
jgi:hypothetical protein